MSKGLGALQRRILDCLDNPPAQPQVKYGPRMEVEKGVYDLRTVARYVVGGEAAKLDVDEFPDFPSCAKWRQQFYSDTAFSAAFSRAVRSLIKRGELEEVRRSLWDGRLTRQVRFVHRRSSPATGQRRQDA